MVRKNSRKTFEELYAPAPPPPTLTTNRFDESFFQNSKTTTKCNKTADRAEAHTSSAQNCRKRNRGSTGGAEQKDEKTFINEERLLGKTAKPKKFNCLTSPGRDNKNVLSFVAETEKEEDTEEFFELIKQTVEEAVGNTLSDILNRNFREMTAKIDDLREQLNANEAKLEKVQSDMNNKIVHYGEENSRHFRYLCMKSEYDKMFYQHQNIMTAVPVDARPNLVNPYPQNFGNVQQGNAAHLASQSKGHGPALQKCLPADMPVPQQCSCHVNGSGDFGNGDPSVSTKSSDLDIKEVKELLQRFFENQQPQKKKHGKDTDMQDDSGDEDEDICSDDLSSSSIEEKLGAGGDS